MLWEILEKPALNEGHCDAESPAIREGCLMARLKKNRSTRKNATFWGQEEEKKSLCAIKKTKSHIQDNRLNARHKYPFHGRRERTGRRVRKTRPSTIKQRKHIKKGKRQGTDT